MSCGIIHVVTATNTAQECVALREPGVVRAYHLHNGTQNINRRMDCRATSTTRSRSAMSWRGRVENCSFRKRPEKQEHSFIARAVPNEF
ncbi:hypothetical protein COOONC_27426 [Cooperia oncophora]